jgi:enolase
MGVVQAARNVTNTLFPRLRGMDIKRQAVIDDMMKDADGTWNKSRLGANAVLGVSMAVARAAALSARRPLYETLLSEPNYLLPVPMMNIISGGAHANNSLDIQEFMIVPHGAPTFSEALRYGIEVFQALKEMLRTRGMPTTTGDTGGFEPALTSNEAALEMIVAAISTVGLTPGVDVSIALDAAASSFVTKSGYDLWRSGAGKISSHDLFGVYETWCRTYPIVSIEDGFGEHDWGGFKTITARLGDKLQIVGDDTYVTHRFLIQQGIYENAGNAALIKLNQIGTVTETIAAITMCHSAGWRAIISGRSGETEDTFIADLCVATGAGQIKAGSVCRGERVAKYNRLLEIERELGSAALYRSPFQAAAPTKEWLPAA